MLTRPRALLGVAAALLITLLVTAWIALGPTADDTGRQSIPPIREGLATPEPRPGPPSEQDGPCAVAEDGEVVARPFTVPVTPSGPEPDPPERQGLPFPGLTVCPGAR